MSYSQHIQNQKLTPATQRPNSRKDEMMEGRSGAALFKIDDFTFLRRCLVMGTSGDTYYADKFEITSEFESVILSCCKLDSAKTSDVIREVSYEGIAIRVDSCIFALLVLSTVAPTEFTRIANDVIRTQSHFHLFMSYVKGGKNDKSGYRGMGSVIQKFGKSWFQDKNTDWLAYQFLKYPQRNGFKVKDEIRLFHPKTPDDAKDALFAYTVDKVKRLDYPELKIIQSYNWVKDNPNEEKVIKAITEDGLTFEMVAPLGVMTDKVWNVLFQTMPLGATIRNLGNLSEHLVFNNTDNTKLLRDKLTNKEALKKARIHPYDLLVANKVYSKGSGIKSNKTWVVKNHVSNTLDLSLETSFDSIESTGQTYFFAIDVSHSMSATVGNSGIISCAEVATAMALASAKAEEECYIYGFKHNVVDLGISSRDTFSSALDKASKQNFGSTDAGKVYELAIQKNFYVDTFVFFTDSESFGGHQAFQLLKKYRTEVNPNARAVYCTLAPYRGSLADPLDLGSLSIEGFNPQTPKLIQEFSLGNI